MVAEIDDAFQRRVRDVVQKRLDAGHDPHAILAELQTRLTPDQAHAVLAACRSPSADQPQRVMMSGKRWGVAVFVGIWATLLLIQNAIVIGSVLEVQNVSQTMANPSNLYSLFIWLAAAKVAILTGAATFFFFGRSKFRFPILAAAILYVQPIGIVLENAALRPGAPPGAWSLVGLSAFISYAVAGALYFTWPKGERRDALNFLRRR